MIKVEWWSTGKTTKFVTEVVNKGKYHKKGQDCHFSDQYYVEDREFPQKVLNLGKREKKTKHFSKDNHLAVDSALRIREITNLRQSCLKTSARIPCSPRCRVENKAHGAGLAVRL